MENPHSVTGSNPEIRIRFASLGIDYSIEATSPNAQTRQEIPQTLGVEAIELFRIQGERIDAISAQLGELINLHGQPDSIPEAELPEQDVPVQPEPDESPGPDEPQSEPEALEAPIEPTQGQDKILSRAEIRERAYARCGATIAHIIKRPDFVHRSHSGNAGKEIREELGMSSVEWKNTSYKLENELNLIYKEKVAPGAKRSTAFGLNVNQVLESDQVFITDEMKQNIRDRLDGKTLPEVAEDLHTDQPQDNSSQNGSGTLKISRRVARAMELDGDRVAGPPKPAKEHEPFLDHSRRPSKRRQGKRS